MPSSDNIRWRIYYGDESTYDNTQGTENEAPSVNIQCIIELNQENGFWVWHTWDWYYYRKDTGKWYGADIYGIIDSFLWDKSGVITALKQGRTVPNEVFARIFNRAHNDLDFPERPTARVQDGERPQANNQGQIP